MLKSESDYVLLLHRTLCSQPAFRKMLLRKLGLDDFPFLGERHREVIISNTRPDILLDYPDQTVIFEAKRPEVRPDIGQMRTYIEESSVLTPPNLIVAVWILGKGVTSQAEANIEELTSMFPAPRYRITVIYWEDILSILEELLPNDTSTQILKKSLTKTYNDDDEEEKWHLELSGLRKCMPHINAAMTIITFLNQIAIFIKNNGLEINGKHIIGEISPRHYPHKEKIIKELTGREQFSYRFIFNEKFHLIESIEWGIKSGLGIYLKVRSYNDNFYQLKEKHGWEIRKRDKGGFIIKIFAHNLDENGLSSKSVEKVVENFIDQMKEMVCDIIEVPLKSKTKIPLTKKDRLAKADTNKIQSYSQKIIELLEEANYSIHWGTNNSDCYSIRSSKQKKIAVGVHVHDCGMITFCSTAHLSNKEKNDLFTTDFFCYCKDENVYYCLLDKFYALESINNNSSYFDESDIQIINKIEDTPPEKVVEVIKQIDCFKHIIKKDRLAKSDNSKIQFCSQRIIELLEEANYSIHWGTNNSDCYSIRSSKQKKRALGVHIHDCGMVSFCSIAHLSNKENTDLFPANFFYYCKDKNVYCCLLDKKHALELINNDSSIYFDESDIQIINNIEDASPEMIVELIKHIDYFKYCHTI